MNHTAIARSSRAIIVALGMAMASVAADQGSEAPRASQTKVVLLGTGNPAIDPDRSGPSTAVVVNDTAYVVDFGPGVVRRTRGAVLQRGVKALEPTSLRVVFATHLHSDHTAGYPDLIFTPWTQGRRYPLEVYGPTGIQAMTAHTPGWLATRPETFQRFSEKYHTTTAELAELAREAKPRLLILYHYSSLSPEELLGDMLARYPGHVVVGRDLDVY